MNLSLVFKLAAGFMVLWVLQMWFLPSMVEETFGWNSSPDLRILMRYMGMAMAALATFHWTLPMWAGENLSNFGMVSAVFWALFGVMGVYEIAMGISPSTAPNLISTGMNFVFSILFFINSRKS